MHIVPFKSDHLDKIIVQPMQEHVRPIFEGTDYGKMLEKHPSYTAIAGDIYLGCGGVISQGTHRGLLWALLDGDAGRRFVQIHRAVLRFIAAQNFNRLEAHVDANFDSAIRWIELLGFEREGLMRNFTPDGRDCYLYARLKNG